MDVPIVEEYLYLGIRISPALEIRNMGEHRLEGGRKTVHLMIPFLRCPVLPMSMRLTVVRSVLLPRLLFGAEIYGMNRALTNRMKGLLNKALITILGGNARMAAARRVCAFAKYGQLQTWVRELVNHPLQSRRWT